MEGGFDFWRRLVAAKIRSSDLILRRLATIGAEHAEMRKSRIPPIIAIRPASSPNIPLLRVHAPTYRESSQSRGGAATVTLTPAPPVAPARAVLGRPTPKIIPAKSIAPLRAAWVSIPRD